MAFNINLIREFFRASNSTYESGFFNKKFDEPSYITFKLEFGKQLSSMINNNSKNYSFRENSTIDTNYDLMPCALFDLDDEDFLNRKFYSAVSYLKDINEFRRAEMLIEFINGMNELQSKYQYYFTEISGLDNLFKVNTSRGSRLNNDVYLEISCMESIDMKIRYLMNLYKKIAWDDTWQRWILPDIMRYFNLIIYITEIRSFQTSKYSDDYNQNNVIEPISNDIENSSKINSSEISEPLILKLLNNIAPTIQIKCNMCEFDITEIGSNISNLKSSLNGDKNPHNNKIRIKVNNLNEIQCYPMFTYGYTNDEHLNGLTRTEEEVNPIPNSYKYEYMHLGDAANNNIILPAADINHEPSRAYYQPGLNSLFEDSNGNKGNGWLNNAVKWGTSYVKNKVDDYANSLLNNNIGGLNISANEILNTIKSKDIISVFGAIKKATMDVEDIYPSVPESFKNKTINNAIFKSVLEGLSVSTATNANEKFLIQSAKEIIKNNELYNKINNLSKEQIEKLLQNSNIQDIANKQSDYDRSQATDLDKKKQIIGFNNLNK